jgi:tRNA pseudouridine32 synthase/23S rRNA pseudouridine746 synthase
MPFELHVDAAVVAVDKPPGLLSVPGRGPDKQDCALHRADARHPGLRVVHRLDQATSGVLLFARHLAAQQALSRAFEERRAHKHYIALVWGDPGPEGLIDLPLVADWPQRPRQKVCHATGRPSQTHWQRLAHEGPWTRLRLTPRTGRAHQLRVHLLALGHPIVGDALYDPQRPGARLMLHAERLHLPHPDGGDLQVHSPCPF